MDFVSFELGKKLKEKGFNWKVNAYYGIHENRFNVHPAKDMNDCEYRCSAPTISQVLKWLRETKNIEVVASFSYSNKVWGYQVGDMTLLEDSILSYDYSFPTYEEAALAGIEYVLDNLI